jgi:hypothetical protein
MARVEVFTPRTLVRRPNAFVATADADADTVKADMCARACERFGRAGVRASGYARA